MLLPSVSRSISTCMYLKDLGRAWGCHVDQLTLRTTKDLRKNYYPRQLLPVVKISGARIESQLGGVMQGYALSYAKDKIR